MEFKTTQKFIRTTPRKLREVASLVRDEKMSPSEALEVLPHVRKRAANPLLKAIKTAIANAGQKGVSPNDLTFKQIQVNEGPAYKRWKAGGRGMVKPYQKRTSHIRIVVEAKDEKKETKKTKKKKSTKKDDKKSKTKKKEKKEKKGGKSK